MNIETEKKIDSILSYIKGELITNFNDEDSLLFVEWSKKKLSDTIKDHKEKEILLQLKNCDNEEDKKKLRIKKKKYLPVNYPYNLKIGDIVHINYGFGYCGEISDGHYGIILSEIKVNKYFVIPLSSEPLKIHTLYFENLGLPSKESTTCDKKSYLRFDQLGHVHYRRLENAVSCERKCLDGEQLGRLFTEIKTFLNFPVDKS